MMFRALLYPLKLSGLSPIKPVGYHFHATGGWQMIDFQTNTDQFEELKAAALMIGLYVFTLLALLVAAAILITRWWMS